MGLIKALSGSVSTVLADQWKEMFYCDSLDSNTLMSKGHVQVGPRSSNTKKSDNIISDGSKIIINEGQCLLVVENGKVVDFSNEAGEYFWQTGTEPSMFNSGWSGLVDSFKNVGKRFTYGGQPSNDQRVYYVNIKEIMDNKVGIGDVPFRDSEFSFTILLQGYGSYSYKITDPIMFYTNVAANVSETMQRSSIDEQLKAEVQHNLQPALGKIALKGVSYDQLPLHTKDIAKELNSELNEEWVEKRGISVVSMALASIKPTEDSIKKISQFQESRIYTDPAMLGSRLGTAQSNAMESAATNSAGAMTGFFGMGMAQQAGGANAMDMMRMATEQKSQTSSTTTQENFWTCASCGSHCKGQFCSECGEKRPEGAPLFKCDKCGFEPENPTNPPKFCPECGDPFNDDDKKQ